MKDATKPKVMQRWSKTWTWEDRWWIARLTRTHAVLCSEESGKVKSVLRATLAARWVCVGSRDDSAKVRYRCACCGVTSRLYPTDVIRAERKAQR